MSLLLAIPFGTPSVTKIGSGSEDKDHSSEVFEFQKKHGEIFSVKSDANKNESNINQKFSWQ